MLRCGTRSRYSARCVRQGGEVNRSRLIRRGIAGFLGTFTAINVLAGLADARLDANGWWLDLRPLPAFLTLPVLAAGAAALIVVAIAVPLRPRYRKVSRGPSCCSPCLLSAMP